MAKGAQAVPPVEHRHSDRGLADEAPYSAGLLANHVRQINIVFVA